ncbi:M4 family metallopeptidase [Bacillus sp. AFS041924]|uniref:M4 family metallopeptidase n=1 Tax=Bacillus sp. AFS041924 TaxID=2033503 RepID=UPI000BFCA840|nr:M4 family metallopeptidase [Bacillus sp. AFS041924]PGS52022.1 peptidase M4 family protein [Bacillus sp. AFS041924]
MALTVAFGGLSTLPSFVNVKASAATVNQALSKEEAVKAYLNSKVVDLMKSGSAWEQFKIVSEQADNETNTYHVRTIEQYKGIPIYGSGQTVALDANNNVYASFGNVTQKLARTVIPTEATISEEDAIATAKEGIEKEIGTVNNYDKIDTQLMVYPFKGKHYLAYVVKASTSNPAPGYFHYFVDATNGEIINNFNAIDNLVDPATLSPVMGKGLDAHGKMQTFPIGKDLNTGTSYLYGASVTGTSAAPTIVPIATFDAHRTDETLFNLFSALFGFTGWEVTTTRTDNMFLNPAAVSAHVNSDKVSKYYQNIHKRHSLDDKGMPLISSVHVGSKWNNAGWNGVEMLYGDGDGIRYGSMSGGLDVTGHEMTHGVVEHTADLTYENESGAINESLADIFGEFTQQYTTGVTEWELGEDITTPNTPNDGGLRSMSDPASKKVSTSYMPSGHYPDTYQDRYIGELDNGGVHINSGINNKAAYLITNGGTNNGYTITKLGRGTAEKIYYRALTNYLTASSGFKEMREAAIQASRDLYPDKNGVPSNQTKAVMDAYSSVGVY